MFTEPGRILFFRDSFNYANYFKYIYIYTIGISQPGIRTPELATAGEHHSDWSI